MPMLWLVAKWIASFCALLVNNVTRNYWVWGVKLLNSKIQVILMKAPHLNWVVIANWMMSSSTLTFTICIHLSGELTATMNDKVSSWRCNWYKYECTVSLSFEWWAHQLWDIHIQCECRCAVSQRFLSLWTNNVDKKHHFWNDIWVFM